MNLAEQEGERRRDLLCVQPVAAGCVCHAINCTTIGGHLPPEVSSCIKMALRGGRDTGGVLCGTTLPTSAPLLDSERYNVCGSSRIFQSTPDSELHLLEPTAQPGIVQGSMGREEQPGDTGGEEEGPRAEPELSDEEEGAIRGLSALPVESSGAGRVLCARCRMGTRRSPELNYIISSSGDPTAPHLLGKGLGVCPIQKKQNGAVQLRVPILQN
ncbi:hypothetical protein FKM82_028718 [Ascaphus truei]